MLQLLDLSEGGTASMISTVMTAVVTGMTTAVGDIATGVGNLVPVVIPIAGTMIAIGVGMRVVRKFTGR